MVNYLSIVKKYNLENQENAALSVIKVKEEKKTRQQLSKKKDSCTTGQLPQPGKTTPTRIMQDRHQSLKPAYKLKHLKK